jgi:hypothetical protein
MAFFRKSKKQDESPRPAPPEGETLVNQAKWDKLERLVKDQTIPSDTDKTDPSSSTDEILNPAFDAQGSTQDLDALFQELGESDTGSLRSELEIDLSENADFIDVTRPATKSKPRSDVSAMMPSQHFDTARANETLKNTDELTSLDGREEEFIPQHPQPNRPDRADLGTMRLDVARISADIQSGEELYRRAQKRIENLTNFVERAEVDFSMLNRLEPENRRLKARNRTIQREIESNSQKMNVLRADLEDRELRLAEKTRIYEETLAKLSAAKRSLQEFERALDETRGSSDRNALKSERLQTSLDVERRENEALRERLTVTINEMEAKKNAYIEAKKVADSLAQDCTDFRHQADSAEKEAEKLRKTLTVAQKQNNAMKAEMISLHEDIRAFKTQSEFSIISREDEMSALQQQVSLLSKQLNIKDEILQNAARDIQELRKVRTAQDLERERLESQIDAQSYQLEQANSELLRSKQDVSDLDKRYRDVATALSVRQSRLMSNEPAVAPDIQPLPPQSTAEIAPRTVTEVTDTPEESPDAPSEASQEALTEGTIQNRITDFRLGLRDEI